MAEDAGYEALPSEYNDLFESLPASNSASSSSTGTFLTAESLRATIRDAMRSELERRG